jgi:hypothetical protein
MGHAAPQVRSAANVVTASNLDDGAARAIERYALGQENEPDGARDKATTPQDEKEPA